MPSVTSELAKENQLPVELDVLSDILGERSKKSDPIHPNARGYKEMAQAIATLMHKAGAL